MLILENSSRDSKQSWTSILDSWNVGVCAEEGGRDFDRALANYRAGDVFDQGLFYAHETFGVAVGDETYCREHHMYYHCFCDPTLQIRTEVPTKVETTYDPNFAEGDMQFKVSDINLDDGTTVLYNETQKQVVGRAKITNGAATIPLKAGTFVNKDTITINGINCVPLIESFASGKNVSLVSTSKVTLAGILSFTKEGISIDNSLVQPVNVTLYNLQGRRVFTKAVDAGKAMLINKKELSTSAGSYIVQVESEGYKVTKKINL